MNRKIPTTIAISIVLVVAILAGGFVYWRYFIFQKELSNQTEIVIPEKPIDETADWQTYRNDKYGFEIKYPQELFFEEFPGEGRATGSEGGKSAFEVSFVENQYKNQEIHYPDTRVEVIETLLSPQEWLNKNSTGISIFDASEDYLYFGVDNKGTTSISNLQGVKFMEEGTSFSGTHILIKKGDNLLFDIANYTTGVGVISEDIFNQMFSTFKFIEPKGKHFFFDYDCQLSDKAKEGETYEIWWSDKIMSGDINQFFQDGVYIENEKYGSGYVSKDNYILESPIFVCSRYTHLTSVVEVYCLFTREKDKLGYVRVANYEETKNLSGELPYLCIQK